MAVPESNGGAWYDYNTSQGYGVNGEQGNDIATPFHTAVSMLFGGTVKSATYEDWGGDVEVLANIPGLGQVTEYMIHLDEIAPGIVPGAHINAGQFIGLSGGENPGYPGAEHPALPQFSTGPHVEWGIKSSQGSPIDPTGYIDEARSGGLGNLGAVAPPIDPGNIVNTPQPSNTPASFSPVGGILGGLGITRLPPWQDALGVLIGAIMIGVAVSIIVREVTAPAEADIEQKAETAAKVAAVAA